MGAEAACLYTTPSSSRKYAGPIFFFSALHCARTRSRRRFAVFEFLGGSEVVSSRGSRKERIHVELVTRTTRYITLSEELRNIARYAQVFSQGTHHHPTKSMPPSWLPPTRVSDMDICFVRSASARYSNAVPRCTVESNRSGKRRIWVKRMVCTSKSFPSSRFLNVYSGGETLSDHVRAPV